MKQDKNKVYLQIDLRNNLIWRAFKYLDDKRDKHHYFNISVDAYWQTNNPFKSYLMEGEDYKIIEANQKWENYINNCIFEGKITSKGKPSQNFSLYKFTDEIEYEIY